jgi:hypothetical protein
LHRTRNELQKEPSNDKRCRYFVQQHDGRTGKNLQRKSKKGEPAGAVGAVVFALAGPEIEFALVNDYGLKGWNIKKDTQVLLSFMDPVGVVGLGAGLSQDNKNVFRTFKGQEWAQKHAAQIIDEAEKTLPMYTIIDKPKRFTKRKKAA